MQDERLGYGYKVVAVITKGNIQYVAPHIMEQGLSPLEDAVVNHAPVRVHSGEGGYIDILLGKPEVLENRYGKV